MTTRRRRDVVVAKMRVMDDDGVRGDMISRCNAVRARMNTGELYVDQGEGLEALEAERTHGKELRYDFNHTRPMPTSTSVTASCSGRTSPSPRRGIRSSPRSVSTGAST